MYFKKFEKNEVTKCINHKFDQNHTDTLTVMMEQWKTYTESAEHISNKRQQFIIWFNGINGILLGIFAGSFQLLNNFDIESHIPVNLLQNFLPMLGLAISLVAVMRILVYKKRKQIKYAQIYAIEKYLPFRLYTNEYYLSKTKNSNGRFFNSGTRIEIFFPIAFFFVYLLLTIWMFL